jgi:aryl-alcohol dehydrogenase-like predicted oxidoreductase
MEKKAFGKNPFSVTPLGLGLAALGRPGYITLGHQEDLQQNYQLSAMENHAHQVLDAAWQAGIRYFDSARSYGRAEAFLGSWLKKREIPREEVAVGSKWGYRYTANWQVRLPKGEKHEIKEHSLARLQQQIQESKALLGEHLTLYQIHSATLESGVLANRAVLQELAHLRNTGLAIGFSVSGTQQAEVIERALEIEFDGVPLFSSVQATWNLLEQSAAPALNAAHTAGLGVIIKEALANGRLTERNRNEDFLPKRELLREFAEARQTSMDALALAAVCAQPFADVVLSGAARIEHLQSNLQALQISRDTPLDELLDALHEPPQTYWQKRSRLAWN